jgi:hypothetical protein
MDGVCTSRYKRQEDCIALTQSNSYFECILLNGMADTIRENNILQAEFVTIDMGLVFHGKPSKFQPSVLNLNLFILQESTQPWSVSCSTSSVRFS